MRLLGSVKQTLGGGASGGAEGGQRSGGEHLPGEGDPCGRPLDSGDSGGSSRFGPVEGPAGTEPECGISRSRIPGGSSPVSEKSPGRRQNPTAWSGSACSPRQALASRITIAPHTPTRAPFTSRGKRLRGAAAYPSHFPRPRGDRGGGTEGGGARLQAYHER